MSDELRRLDAEVERQLFGREGHGLARDGVLALPAEVPRYSDPVEGWALMPAVLGRVWELGLDGWLVRHLLSRLAIDRDHDEDADTSSTVGMVVKEFLFGSIRTGEKLPEMACRAALEALKARWTTS